MNTAVQRGRSGLFVYKTLVFIILLLPLAVLINGAVGNTLGPDPADVLANATGEWALRLLLLTLAITPLQKLTALAKLAQFRRMLGLYAFFYAAVHFLVYVFFLLGLQWRELWADIVDRPYITVGFVALLLLIPLAVTSTSSARRQMGRAWKRLHKLVYWATGFALLHLWWQLRSDMLEAVVYIGIFMLLMLMRKFNPGAIRRRG